MRVSLIFTLLNEAPGLPEMLRAVDRQSRQPDEVVIVDGGSTDGSLEILGRWAAGRPGVRVISLPGANISAGRNAAIRAATGDVIAVTDAGCTPEPGWLSEMIAGFGDSVDVVMGFYAADPRSRFERLMSCLNLPNPEEVDPERFMPSSRSVAFRKRVWEEAGGYPEWLAVGEDMLFNFAVLQTGAARRFAPSAIVRWRLRPDLPSTLRQYFRYGEGDGKAGMYPRRHGLRFATYAAACAVVAAGTRRPVLLAALPAGAAVRMLPAYRRAFSRLDPTEALLSLGALPALELLIDLAKMAGYVSGRAGRRRPPFEPRGAFCKR